jgi:hypothetical protein
MAAPKVTLYFDVVSPFSHIAFHVLKVSDSMLASDVLEAASNIFEALSHLCQMRYRLCAHFPGWVDEGM